MTTTRRDIVSGAVFGAGAITLYTYASAFPVREGQSPAVSAGFYPRILALFLAVLAVIQIVSAILAERKYVAEITANTDEHASAGQPAAEQMRPLWKDRRSLGLFLFTVGALVVYPFLLRLAGFTITGLLFVGSLIVALSAEKRSGKQLALILVITVVIALLTYAVFRRFLQIPFPTGIFGR